MFEQRVVKGEAAAVSTEADMVLLEALKWSDTDTTTLTEALQLGRLENKRKQ